MGHTLPIDLGQLGLNVSGSPRFFAKIDPRMGREIGMYGQWQLPQKSGLVHAARSHHFESDARVELGETVARLKNRLLTSLFRS